MAEQVPLLPSRPALGRDDFIVADANRLALAMVDDWRNWPGGKLVLTGPSGSGKTHLAHVWAAQSGARIVPAASLDDEALPMLASGPVCVEDADTIAGTRAAEVRLFHLHNMCQTGRQPLMVTGTGALPGWGLVLPDLVSRLQAAQAARLDDPDDALLAAVLEKMFRDRLTIPAPTVIPYLVTHMPRSFDFARRLVDVLDRAALGTTGGVTRTRAAEVLARLAHDPSPGAE